MMSDCLNICEGKTGDEEGPFRYTASGATSCPIFCVNSAPWRSGGHSSGVQMDSNRGPEWPL